MIVPGPDGKGGVGDDGFTNDGLIDGFRVGGDDVGDEVGLEVGVLDVALKIIVVSVT